MPHSSLCRLNLVYFRVGNLDIPKKLTSSFNRFLWILLKGSTFFIEWCWKVSKHVCQCFAREKSQNKNFWMGTKLQFIWRNPVFYLRNCPCLMCNYQSYVLKIWCEFRKARFKIQIWKRTSKYSKKRGILNVRKTFSIDGGIIFK